MLAGDEEALATLYRRHHAAVYRFSVQMSGIRVLAEDVTQEVFIVLMRDGAGFEPERGSLTAFLYGIARNLVRQKLAREQFYVRLGDELLDVPIAPGGALDELARHATIGAVRKAVL